MKKIKKMINWNKFMNIKITKKSFYLCLFFCFLSFVYANQEKLKKISLQDVEKSKVEKVFLQMPVFSQGIQCGIPKTWNYMKPEYERLTKDSYMVEYIPKGQDINNWQDLFTIQGFKNAILDKKFNKELMLKYISDMLIKISKENFVFKVISKENIDGYPAFIVLMGLSNSPDNHASGVKTGQAEISLYAFIDGKNDLYLIHKGWRMPAFFKDKIPIKEEDIQYWKKVLKDIRLIEKQDTLFYKYNDVKK
jgi:hypothetical protein